MPQHQAWLARLIPLAPDFRLDLVRSWSVLALSWSVLVLSWSVLANKLKSILEALKSAGKANGGKKRRKFHLDGWVVGGSSLEKRIPDAVLGRRVDSR